jgi:hypothetical protein
MAGRYRRIMGQASSEMALLRWRLMKVNRETLYKQVWAEPMIVVATRYGVSANFLARVCHTLNVPHPPRGYWAKLKVGAAPPKPDLPAAVGGHPIEWTKGMTAIARALTPSSTLSAAITKRRGWRPARHALVEGVADLFQQGYTSNSGYLRPRKRKLPDIFASAAGLAAALSLASELYLTPEPRMPLRSGLEAAMNPGDAPRTMAGQVLRAMEPGS